ncbi:hypothetical protein SAMN03097699_0572 [Flavobacteriaceae bacterium MAR_2010_188]|nr:hypothetical protein SAMN03097699_0572 [Flavobacteriaceae bacterium MAR_2010_188]
MKKIKQTTKNLILPLLALGLVYSCDFDKTQEGELPEVDVDISAEEGEMPEYDVDWAEVNVGTTTKTVEVPKVVVVMEEETVEVPTIDVDMPDDNGEKSERTLMIEAEVTGKEHNIDIQQIWASGKTLHVIAELEELDTDLGDKKLRVQDQVTLNAADLDVRYYIVGERPDRVFNDRHDYVKSMSDLEDKIGEHRVIYTK